VEREEGSEDMKRFLLLLVAALVAAALMAGIGTASDTKGPPCTNITSGDAGYGGGTVQAIFDLSTPACAEGSYLLEIYDFSTGTNLLASTDQATVAGTQVTIKYSFAAGQAPSDGVCIVVTTFYKKHLADRGPDSGCYPVPADSSGGKTYS
jgi:hypothetical protein